MTSLLPWPDAYLAGRSWSGVRSLLERLVGLEREQALPGTVMLVGEGGLGREALAVELGAALICRAPRALPCDCAQCSRVRRGIHPDFTVVDIDVDEKTGKRKEEISIRQVREIGDNLAARPFEGRRRVVVFVSAHTPPLNTHAASALLKTLEEPPPHATMVLLAANPARVLPTIVSRSVQVRVPSPSRGDLVAVLGGLHGLDEQAAAAHLTACFDDGHAALLTDPQDGAAALAATSALVEALLGGDDLAALCLGVRAKAAPETIPLVARMLVAGARRLEPDAAEGALDAAARLLQAERRRAALHLDPESVTLGALAPLLQHR